MPEGGIPRFLGLYLTVRVPLMLYDASDPKLDWYVYTPGAGAVNVKSCTCPALSEGIPPVTPETNIKLCVWWPALVTLKTTVSPDSTVIAEGVIVKSFSTTLNVSVTDVTLVVFLLPVVEVLFVSPVLLVEVLFALPPDAVPFDPVGITVVVGVGWIVVVWYVTAEPLPL